MISDPYLSLSSCIAEFPRIQRCSTHLNVTQTARPAETVTRRWLRRRFLWPLDAHERKIDDNHGPLAGRTFDRGTTARQPGTLSDALQTKPLLMHRIRVKPTPPIANYQP